MNKREVQELFYITLICNVGSILKQGILCHNLARRIKHVTIASKDVQIRRSNRIIQGGGRLHDYANLYFNARNPMMYTDEIKNNHQNLCVLSIHPNVMEKAGVAIADGNAACDFTSFYPYPDGLSKLNFERIYTEIWNDSDRIKKDENTRLIMAEVLVPERIDPSYILKAYVSCNEAKFKLMDQNFELPVVIKADMFFQ